MVRALAVFLVVGVTSPAFAHLYISSPTPRYGMRDIKDGPCGIDGGERSDNINYYRSGETITIVFDEYVGHPGHYRVAFDDDGDDFEDPICLENCDDSRMGDPVWAADSTGMVLMDLIEDRPGTETYTLEVTLPDIECDNCTLQVIQVMYDKFPYTIGGNDNYYNCVDLVLTREDIDVDAGPRPDASVPDGGPDFDAGGSDDAGSPSDSGSRADAGTGGGSGCGVAGSGAGALWLLSLVALRRRARS